jgi:hypothetical protein
MSKLLNMRENSSLVGIHGASLTGSGAYVPPLPRVALGFAGLVMAVITIAASVILPARYDSGAPGAPLQLASQSTSPAIAAAGAIMSITVVAAREPRSSKASLRVIETAPRPEQAVETPPSAIFRVSSAAR